MTDTEIGLCRLFAACWEAFTEGMGIDPQDLESMLDHSGLAVWLPATEEDVQAWGDKFELEVGDMLLKLTPEGRRLATEGRRLIREAPKPT